MLGRGPFYTLATGLFLIAAACGGTDVPASTTPATSSATVSSVTTVATTSTSEDLDTGGGEDRSGELVGRWEIINYAFPDGGGLTNVVGDDPAFIQFNADGSVDYHTGCNSGSTVYTVSGTYYVPESALDDRPEGQMITLGPVFEQTERGCEGFLGDQDRDLPDNMGTVSRFLFDGDRLWLLDESLLIEAVKSD